jgi:DNA (cytosine-5)-methyltransferase 1
MLKARQGEQDPKHFSTFRLWADRPANTLRKDFLGYLHYWHPVKFRPLNLDEWARIGSFPDDFIFTDKKDGCQRIGNSVPPNLMKAIAEHIKTNILEATE